MSIIKAVERESERPLISIVIPTYNQARFLLDCIDRAKNQTYQPVEVIVVNNASTDDTQKVLDSAIGVQVIHSQENKGPSYARNLGSQAATGTYIVYVDGDDRLDLDCLEHKIELIEGDDETGMVVGGLRIIDESGKVKRVDPLVEDSKLTEISFEMAVDEMNCPTCGLLVRKAALDEIGGWDESLWIAEDSDLLIRMSAKYIVKIDHEVKADYRQAGPSLSRNPGLMFDSYTNMLRKNRHLAPDPKRYDQIADNAFRERMCNNVLGNILKDEEGNKLGRFLKVIRDTPPFLSIAIYWGLRFTKNQIRKRFGKVSDPA